MSNNNNNKRVVEGELTFCRYMYPKTGHSDGDFAIVSMYVEECYKDLFNTNEQWGTIVIKGNMPRLRKDTVYKARLEESYNKSYKSYEYEVKFINIPQKIDTPEDREAYLRSLLTEKQVESLKESFDDPLQVILNEDIDRLCSVKGIKAKTANDIITKITSNMDYSVAYVELEKYDLTKKMIDKLIANYKSADVAIQKVKKNPYILAEELEGVGFKKADEIALKTNIKPESAVRVAHFILHYLKEQAIGGRSYVPQREVMTAIVENLELDTREEKVINNIRKAIYSLKDSKKLWWNEEKTVLALQKYKDMEYEIAKEIERLSNSSYKFAYKDWEKVVDEIEEEQGWKYTQEQRDGVKTTLDNNVVVITGLAGTGKTTVTKAMTRVLKEYSIGQCALSGRAAQRISENTGMEAKTIHKMLGIGGMKIPNGQLEYEIIIFDEATMPSLELVLALLKSIATGSKLIIIGDYGQLTAIGAGNFFMDLLESETVPVVRLTEVHRQAQASAIISKSIAIRNQEQLFPYGYEGDMVLGELEDLEVCVRENKEELTRLVLEKFEQEYNLANKDINKVQIIVPTRMRGEICCKEFNEKIQRIYNSENIENSIKVFGKYQYNLCLNDKVIVTKNNKKVFSPDGDKRSIFNGNLGTIIDIDIDKKSIIVDIVGVGEVVIQGEVLKTIELAYAITCHKLQGSSAERVIIAFDNGSFMLLSCEWLYTAITRAEKKAVITAENKSVCISIGKRETNNKATFLPYALKNIEL